MHLHKNNGHLNNEKISKYKYSIKYHLLSATATTFILIISTHLICPLFNINKL